MHNLLLRLTYVNCASLVLSLLTKRESEEGINQSCLTSITCSTKASYENPNQPAYLHTWDFQKLLNSGNVFHSTVENA